MSMLSQSGGRAWSTGQSITCFSVILRGDDALKEIPEEKDETPCRSSTSSLLPAFCAPEAVSTIDSLFLQILRCIFKVDHLY